MNCLDCVNDAELANAAVGVCSDCGAGVCRAHARVTARQLHVDAVIARRIAVDPPARVVRCGMCQSAHTAHPDAT